MFRFASFTVSAAVVLLLGGCQTGAVVMQQPVVDK